MVEIYTVPSTHVGLFKNDRFDPACKAENAQPLEGQPDLKHGGWSFTEYSPERAAYLYHHWKKCFPDPQIHPGVKEAYEQGLSLLEVCAGNYGNPLYIAVVPGLDVGALKKQWHLDYCRFCRLVTRNRSNGENAGSSASVTGSNPKGGNRR